MRYGRTEGEEKTISDDEIARAISECEEKIPRDKPITVWIRDGDDVHKHYDTRFVECYHDGSKVMARFVTKDGSFVAADPDYFDEEE